MHTFTTALNAKRGEAPSIQLTQNIYVEGTSYVGQLCKAAMNLKQIARAVG